MKEIEKKEEQKKYKKESKKDPFLIMYIILLRTFAQSNLLQHVLLMIHLSDKINLISSQTIFKLHYNFTIKQKIKSCFNFNIKMKRLEKFLII